MAIVAGFLLNMTTPQVWHGLAFTHPNLIIKYHLPKTNHLTRGLFSDINKQAN